MRFLRALSVAPLFCGQILLAQFTQFGPKLVGAGSAGGLDQGYAVAISADGSTAIVGAPGDHGALGAAWVYTHASGVWTQQGSKLVGVDVTETAQHGTSVAISADGNTAIVGGYGDNNYTGAAWVYTRTDGVWTQQGGLSRSLLKIG